MTGMTIVMTASARWLHHGIAIADGTPEQVVRDMAVIGSRLGAEAL
jgi:ABC-type branched-subunit amino acid transport system ATPase component